MSRRIVEGQTTPVDKQLKIDGAAFSLAGATVSLVLKDKDGATVDATGKVSVTDMATSKVAYNPGASDLVGKKSPYRAHWKVVDGTGKIHFFPSDKAEEWTVHEQ